MMFTRRAFVPEYMDDPDIDREELRSALRFIRRVNARLGGTSACLGWLDRLSRDWPRERPIRILDVGTGSADIPSAIVRWADRTGRLVTVVGVDNHRTTLELAAEHLAEERSTPSSSASTIELVEADALKLLERFEPGSFDVAHAGMFMHHLPDIEVVTALRIMQRLAPGAVIWNDLVRDLISRVAIRFLTLGTPVKVRHDAVVSVAKGFTRPEALDLARRAGLERAVVRRHLFGRFTLIAPAPM